jgi:hypothetical protein
LGKGLISFFGIPLVLAGGAALFFLAYSEPSTTALDADLADIRGQIKAADEEATKYSGGLMKTVIDLRKDILLSTEAMLAQKRASLIRRIDLRYTVTGSILAPASAEKLAEIISDIEKAKAKLAEDEKTAARYTGGLLQVMSLMNTEVDRLAISQLGLAYYGAKYGLSFPIKVELPNPTPKTDRGPSQNSPGLVVKDKDAL